MKTKSKNSIWFHNTLAEQLRAAIKSGKIGCASCKKELATYKNYRCYYCNTFFCPSCAKKHFEKDEHKNWGFNHRLLFVKNKIRLYTEKFQSSKFGIWALVKIGRATCSGWSVYPGGLKCPGCEDCSK